jgi:ribosomal protein L29
MKLSGIDALLELKEEYLNLKRQHSAASTWLVEDFARSMKITSVLGPEKKISVKLIVPELRQFVLDAFQKKIDEAKTKLMMVGVDDFEDTR